MSWSEVFKEKFRAGISMDLQGVFEKDGVFGWFSMVNWW